MIVERGPALAERAARRLAAAGVPVIVLADAAGLAALPPRPGLVVANELFDALPARRLRRTASGLEEAHVVAAGDGLAEAWLPVADEPALADLPAGRELCLPRGAERLLGELADGIARGLVLVIDYGHPRRLLRADDGPGNPMRGFRGGTLAPRLVADPGEVDLTAHVDFTALALAGRALGLEPVFFTEQTYLLLALGFLDDPEAAAARRLIHPEDLGGAFRCLGLGRGLDPAPWRALELRDRSGWLVG